MTKNSFNKFVPPSSTVCVTAFDSYGAKPSQLTPDLLLLGFDDVDAYIGHRGVWHYQLQIVILYSASQKTSEK